MAALGAVVAAQFSSALDERLAGVPLTPAARVALDEARSETLATVDPAVTGPAVAEAVEAASVQAFHVGIGIAAGLVALGGVLGSRASATRAARSAARTAGAGSSRVSPSTPPASGCRW